MPTTKHLVYTTLLCLCMLTIMHSAAHARETQPTPIGGGSGITAFAPDESSPTGNTPTPGWHAAWEDQVRQDFIDYQLSEKSEGSSDIGGYDNMILEFNDIRHSSLAITSGGNIYLAAEIYSAVNGYGIRIYRSTDNGITFSLWGQRENTIQSENFRSPSILVAEGSADLVFLVYTNDSVGSKTINMVSSPLGLQSRRDHHERCRNRLR